MSHGTIGNLLGFGFGLVEDPRKIAIVKLLIEKTKEGKARWAKQRSAITASLPGLEVNFVTQLTILGGEQWQLFTVRDTQGNELIRITPSIPSFLLPPPPASVPVPTETTTTLADVVNDLFTTVNRSAGDELDRAISTIKNL